MTNNYTTMQDQVSSETAEELSMRTLHTTLAIQDDINNVKLTIPYQSLVNRYRYFLEPYIEEEELTDAEFAKYCRNPQVLSEDLYGTTLLWPTILELNHCVSRTDFTKRIVKYYDPLQVSSILNDVILKEEELKEINTSY